ncbi:hypothetical protein ElyMa_003556200 [Elysia marginata]|uniref:Uncharacterized protein n=1 Tax=Elysia marginata TaxID=1093978 RepID=A0AAV4EL67_9GAST|nr:hypothetical protein ElyMa_003556200 [Elysia marginata]
MSSGEEGKITPAGAEVSETNCLSNGEQAREPPKVYKNAEDNLNFGWFSLPRSSENSGRPVSVSGRKQQGRKPVCQHAEAGPAQTSQSGGNHGQAAACVRGTPETCLPPPSRQGYAHQQQPADSQRLVVSDDPDMADFECSDPRKQQQQQQQQQQMFCNAGQNYGQGDDPAGQGPQAEIDAVDWPLSRAAQEMLMRESRPPAEPRFAFLNKQGMSSRAGSRVSTPSAPPLPPTPMPPLHWNGYNGSSRPTYASWRERWHRDNAHPDPHCQAQNLIGNQQHHNIFSEYDNNNNNSNTRSAEANGWENIVNSPSLVTMVESNKDKSNNSGSKRMMNTDSFDLKEKQGGYWNRHWSKDHITNIGTDFIGYDGSIFRSLTGSGRSTVVNKSLTSNMIGDNDSVVQFPTDNDKDIPCVKKEIGLSCRRSLKKWASSVDPINRPSNNGLWPSRSDVDAKCGDVDFMEEGLPEYKGSSSSRHVRHIKKKTSFSLNFLTRVNRFKQTALLWGKKVRGGSHSRKTYCLFENDY